MMTCSRARRRAATAAGVAVALCIPLAAAAATAGDAPSSVDTVHRLALFSPTGSAFVESLAINSRGVMFVSKTIWGAKTNTGQVIRVSPGERKQPFGPRLDLTGLGMLSGIAINGRDQVYVARVGTAAAGATAPSLVYRMTAHRAIKVATLPDGSFPNGLAAYRGRLYLADSDRGAIWRFRPGGTVKKLSEPWVSSPLLEPNAKGSLGVNGIAFWHGRMFAVNASKGTLVRIGLRVDGSARHPRRVVRSPSLDTADGIAFDPYGHLWVVGNGVGRFGQQFVPPHGQFLMLLTRQGRLWDRTTDAPWMNYPTAIALGRTPATANRMFVTDGAFYGGSADLVSFHLGR